MSSGPGSSPLRILVRGASTVSWIAQVEPGVDAWAYPRALEDALYHRGIPTSVRVSAPLASSSLHILRDADDEIFGFNPDVIVMNTGHMENLHMLLPIPFSRHVFTRTARPGRWRQLYRRGILWPLYVNAVKLQVALEPRLGPRIFGRRRAAIVRHLNRYIDVARGNGNPFVIVMGFTPPVDRTDPFPGVAARLLAMNDALQALVAARGETNTVWFDPTGPLEAAGLPRKEAIGDGIHFTPPGHRIVGVGLADVVAQWRASHSTRGPSGLSGEQEQDILDAEE